MKLRTLKRERCALQRPSAMNNTEWVMFCHPSMGRELRALPSAWPPPLKPGFAADAERMVEAWQRRIDEAG